MQKSKQFLLISFAVLVILVTAGLYIHLYFGISLLQSFLDWRNQGQDIAKTVVVSLILAYLIAGAIYLIAYAFRNGRMSKKLVQKNEIGSINIDVYAIEAIALNAAKTAQAGIKTAKAKASTDKQGAIMVVLDCILYSEVDIPSQMLKIQERVKKDIERYTGLTVSNVLVKVNRVEVVGARVEK